MRNDEMQSRKLLFLGHIARADVLCTGIYHGRIDSTRSRERARRRWMDRRLKRMILISSFNVISDENIVIRSFEHILVKMALKNNN